MEKKVALVTGSSRGIGKSIATMFAKNNIDVIVNYVNNKDQANALVENLNDNYGINAIAIKCDISNENQVKEMFDKIKIKYGKIDILVNNASICNDSLIFDKDIENIKKILEVNIIGTYLCSKYASLMMLENKNGNIVNISSTNAIDTYYPESCDYDASKAGIISLTHNFAQSLAPYIRVNCICPGWVDTDMNKELSQEQKIEEEHKILLNRFAKPEEIAEVVKFIVSNEASYVNNTVIRVDGGTSNK